MLILSGALIGAIKPPPSPSAAEQAAHRAKEAATVQGLTSALAAALAVLAIFFAFARLPKDPNMLIQQIKARRSLRVQKPLPSCPSPFHSRVPSAFSCTWVVKSGIGSFLINSSVKQYRRLSAADAAQLRELLLGRCRFIGFAVMRSVSPGKALAFNCSLFHARIATAIPRQRRGGNVGRYRCRFCATPLLCSRRF